MYKVLVKKQTTFVNLYEDDNTEKKFNRPRMAIQPECYNSMNQKKNPVTI